MAKRVQAVSNKAYIWILFAVLFVIYLPVLIDLVSVWYTDSNYSHGFLVPLISAGLLWRKRKELAQTGLSSNSYGLVLILCAIALFVIGNGGSEYFTVRFSLLLMLFGIILYHFGSEIIRKSWFAIVFLIFMIPIPYVIYFSATFPMQLLASKVSAALLNIIGMPVIRQGNIIHLPDQALEVAEACSGLRSLVSLGALAAIYAYISQERLSAKIILFLSTIPIAIIGNIIRVFITSLVMHTSKASVTDEPLHTIMGASVFVVAFILLFIFGAILRKMFR